LLGEGGLDYFYALDKDTFFETYIGGRKEASFGILGYALCRVLLKLSAGLSCFKGWQRKI
jgi:hypothetical protein